MGDRASVAVLPPVILLGAIVSGVALAWAYPIAALPVGVAVPLGVVFVGLAIALALWAASELANARTAFDVRRSTTAVVVSGPYRLSRNPVYLSMVLLQLGIGAILNSLWILALTWPLGSMLCITAIKPEERYLERKFSSTYATYKASVRRWM
ncbi:MAG TPA: isoprenylcysteine carboxylmethyltransferase family protein [Vicinamibacterales bacterium]|nr:isoprenylcysteine carboxylmethyltransferase family protein [Vicinamibacterales bacterium]